MLREIIIQIIDTPTRKLEPGYRMTFMVCNLPMTTDSEMKWVNKFSNETELFYNYNQDITSNWTTERANAKLGD